MHGAIVSRIKILAEMDIAERRLPQDGRVRLKLAGDEVECSVSTSPTLHGELVMIAIRARAGASGSEVTLENTGLSPAELQQITGLLAAPAGLILVTGGANSGRSTTLYALMAKAANSGAHAVSTEERILRPLPGVVRYQIRLKIGLTIALLLSKGLQQNPDVVMVDPIRDAETASLALQAASERLVLASVAGQDAVGAINALLDMDMDPGLLAAVLNLVVAQRLVRRVCTACNGQGSTPAGASCELCNGSRFRGQVGVFQLLAIDENVRASIRSRARQDLPRVAAESGLVSLRDAALHAAARGVTTADEVTRVFA
jgi:general secretion pathway protein E